MRVFRHEKKFVYEVGKIKDPVVFFGIAQILKVPCFIDKDNPREFGEVLNDIFDAYFAADPKKQKELLKILKDANKCKGSLSNGSYTKDSAETVSNKEV